MSIVIYSSAVFSGRVAGAIGSKDAALAAAVGQQALYLEALERDPVGTPQVLAALLAGTPPPPAQREVSAYMFISLCQTLQTPMPHAWHWYLGIDTDPIAEYLEEDFGISGFSIREQFFSAYSHQCPFELPNYGGFPLVGYVPAAAFPALAAQMAHIRISEDDLWALKREMDYLRAEAHRHIRALAENITFCAEQDLDLFSFCH